MIVNSADCLICSLLEIETESGVVGVGIGTDDRSSGSDGRFGAVRLIDDSKRFDSTCIETI